MRRIASGCRRSTETEICGVTFEAFPVEHSIRAPAVGYRVTAIGKGCVFYVPDVVRIYDRSAALAGMSPPQSIMMARLASGDTSDLSQKSA